MSTGGGDDAAESSSARRDRRAIAVTLAVGLLAIAGGLVATLSRTSVRRIATNDVAATRPVYLFSAETGICQPDERIPAGSGAIRVSLGGARAAPAVRLRVFAGDADAAAASGSGVVRSGTSSVIPVRPIPQREIRGQVCIDLDTSKTAAAVVWAQPTGGEAGAVVNGQVSPVRLHVDYLQPTVQSWWSYAGTVVRRMGLGHVWSGPSVALLAALLTLTSIGLASWQLVRTSR